MDRKNFFLFEDDLNFSSTFEFQMKGTDTARRTSFGGGGGGVGRRHQKYRLSEHSHRKTTQMTESLLVRNSSKFANWYSGRNSPRSIEVTTTAIGKFIAVTQSCFKLATIEFVNYLQFQIVPRLCVIIEQRDHRRVATTGFVFGWQRHHYSNEARREYTTFAVYFTLQPFLVHLSLQQYFIIFLRTKKKDNRVSACLPDGVFSFTRPQSLSSKNMIKVADVTPEKLLAEIPREMNASLYSRKCADERIRYLER